MHLILKYKNLKEKISKIIIILIIININKKKVQSTARWQYFPKTAILLVIFDRDIEQYHDCEYHLCWIAAILADQ